MSNLNDYNYNNASIRTTIGTKKLLYSTSFYEYNFIERFVPFSKCL